MNAVKHSGCWGVPARRLAVALSAASPRFAAGFPLQSLTRTLQLVLALLVICPLAYAQNPCPSEEVVRDLVSQRLNPEKRETRLLVACDTAMLDHQLDKFIKHDRKYRDEGRKATIKLTPEEKTFLVAELKKENNRVWQDGELSEVQRLPTDSMLTYLRARGERARSVLQFTRPIFIRDCSVCLVYYSQFFGGIAGPVHLAFFKKTDGHWSEWVFAHGGEF